MDISKEKAGEKWRGENIYHLSTAVVSFSMKLTA
jgi:hypothetical protein